MLGETDKYLDTESYIYINVRKLKLYQSLHSATASISTQNKHRSTSAVLKQHTITHDNHHNHVRIRHAHLRSN
jgi:hypothetical protein